MPASFSSTPLHASGCLRRSLRASSTRAEKAMPSLAAVSSASVTREASTVTHFVFFTDGEGGWGINRVEPARSITPYCKDAIAALSGALQVRRLTLRRDRRNIVDPTFYIVPRSAGCCEFGVLHCAVVRRDVVDAPCCIAALLSGVRRFSSRRYTERGGAAIRLRAARMSWKP